MASIMRMQELGILEGYEDGTFRPDGLLKQDEAAVLIDRLVQKMLNLEADNQDNEEDSDMVIGVPGWSKKSVLKGFKNNYINMKRYHSQVQCDRLLVGVTLYKITYKDTIDKVKYANMSRTATITGLSQDKEFTFTVYARDAAGNWSSSGPSVDATTLVFTKTTITAISAITGEARVGVELTVGTLTPTNAAATYHWLISDTADGTYAAITGAATTNKYTPVAINAGKYIKVTATGTGDFTGTVTSEATSAVAISLAEAAAVTAINSAASTAEMAIAITTYSGVLGLSLTDYNALINREPVLADLMDPIFLNKAEIKAAFDAAVAGQKEEEE